MTAETVLHESPDVRVARAGENVRLVYLATEAAGAVGRRQGEAFLAALAAVQASGCQHLTLEVDSAGAHFGEPLQGLDFIDRIIQRLWDLKGAGVRLKFHCEGWLFGGMAMAAAACADEVVLGPQARMGLFGHRVSGEASVLPLPPPDFQPPGCLLSRKAGD